MSLRQLAAEAKWKHVGHHGRLLTPQEIRRIKKRGYEAERELVKKLRVHSFKAMRIPVSAPSNEPLPDVFATKGNCLLAFEVKSPRQDRAYFRKDQVQKLFDFLNLFSPYQTKLAVLAAKFPYNWVFKVVDKSDDYVLRNKERNTFNMEKLP